MSPSVFPQLIQQVWQAMFFVSNIQFGYKEEEYFPTVCFFGELGENLRVLKSSFVFDTIDVNKYVLALCFNKLTNVFDLRQS
jgi:hypothetical protein